MYFNLLHNKLNRIPDLFENISCELVKLNIDTEDQTLNVNINSKKILLFCYSENLKKINFNIPNTVELNFSTHNPVTINFIKYNKLKNATTNHNCHNISTIFDDKYKPFDLMYTYVGSSSWSGPPPTYKSSYFYIDNKFIITQHITPKYE